MRGKLSIFSAEIVITGRLGEAPKVRASVQASARRYLDRMKARPLRHDLEDLARSAMPIGRFLKEALGGGDEPPPAPPAMPHSRREVFEQREQSQRGMQKTLRNALALDTIEAFYDDKSDGPIRRLKGTGDPEAPPCSACGVSRALPMDQEAAAYVREAFRKARMPAAMAYAFATTRVIVTQKNRSRLCSCDVVAWDVAVRTFQRYGRETWRRFGLAP